MVVVCGATTYPVDATNGDNIWYVRPLRNWQVAGCTTGEYPECAFNDLAGINWAVIKPGDTLVLTKGGDEYNDYFAKIKLLLEMRLDLLYLAMMKITLFSYLHHGIISKIAAGRNDSLQIPGFKYA